MQTASYRGGPEPRAPSRPCPAGPRSFDPPTHPPRRGGGIIWGVTLGLAIAHWFAFRVAARLVGFTVARGGGATRARALVYALVVLVVAVAIALLKNGLVGH
jgi:hypothetical protein